MFSKKTMLCTLGLVFSFFCIQKAAFAFGPITTSYQKAKVSFGEQVCNYRKPVSTAGDLPKDYKKQITDSIRHKLADPDSLKNVSYDEAYICYGNDSSKKLYGIGCHRCYWVVIFQIDVKNRKGGYSRRSQALAYFRKGKLFYSKILQN